MPLAVSLIYPDPLAPDGFALWGLAVDSIDETITREIAPFSLPVASNNQDLFLNRPVVWLLDLGMMSEVIVLHGTSADYPSDTTQPTYTQLKEIVRCASSIKQTSIQSGSLFLGNPVLLSVQAGPNQDGASKSPPFSRPPTGMSMDYEGGILSFTGHRDGGDTKWIWTLNFAVVNFPTQSFYPAGTTP